MTDQFESFKEVVRPWRNALRRVQKTMILIKEHRYFQIRRGHIWIDDGDGEPDAPDIVVKLPNLLAIRETVRLREGEFESLLNGLEYSPTQFAIGGSVYSFSENPAAGPKPDRLSHAQSPLTPGMRRVPQLDIISHHPRGPDPSSLSLDAILLAHRPPYSGWNDLLSELSISPMDFSPSMARVVNVLVRAPWSPAKSSKLDSTGIKAAINFPAELDVNKLSFGLIIQTAASRPRRLNIDPPFALSSQTQSTNTIEIEVPDADAVEATITISFEGHWYGWFNVQHSSRRYSPLAQSHKYFIGDGSIGALIPSPAKIKGQDADILESITAIIVALGGLQTLAYRRLITDAPDILATTSIGDVLAIEVTLGNPKPGKIDNLQRRAALLHQSFPEKQRSLTKVFPILVTALKKSEAGDFSDYAKRLGIALFFREDLEAAALRLPNQRPLKGEIIRRFLEGHIQSK